MIQSAISKSVFPLVTRQYQLLLGLQFLTNSLSAVCVTERRFLYRNLFCGPASYTQRSENINCHVDPNFHNSGMSLDIKPAPIGVEIRGIDLNKPVAEDLINFFKEEVHKQRLLIFKDQGVVAGDRHVEISKWFGELESTFYKHPKSPHPDVFRVSNDEIEGCRNVGRTGWHIDGSFMMAPFSFALYHMTSVPEQGNTAFVPLEELIESLKPKTREKWEHLWMVSDRRSGLAHPLIYPHPVTKKTTLCFHLGMTESFIWDYGGAQERETSVAETMQILKEIHQEITKDSRKLIFSHKWEIGDFIISDNLAVGHEATPETQFPRSEVGLRVLHRTTVQGNNIPEK